MAPGPGVQKTFQLSSLTVLRYSLTFCLELRDSLVQYHNIRIFSNVLTFFSFAKFFKNNILLYLVVQFYQCIN